jgi:hypothetical protein
MRRFMSAALTLHASSVGEEYCRTACVAVVDTNIETERLLI